MVLLSSVSWNSIPNLAQAFVPSTQFQARRMHLASTNGDMNMGATTYDGDYQTLEPTLELLKGWTEEYLQDVLTAEDRLNNAQAQEPWHGDQATRTGC